MISRIDADPDLMPRLNNFGLNVFEFRALFCHECPEAFWRIAFLCCDMDPDSRPPFGRTHRWLQDLAAADNQASSAVLQELELYSQG